jgi:hypothetical protein
VTTIKSLNVTQAVSDTEVFLKTENSLPESTRKSIQTLAALVYSHMFHGDFLLPFPAIAVQGFGARRKGFNELGG